MPTDQSSSQLLNNAKKHFSIKIDDEDENLGLEHFADFIDEDDVDDDGYADDIVELDNLENSNSQQKGKKSSKLMPVCVFNPTHH